MNELRQYWYAESYSKGVCVCVCVLCVLCVLNLDNYRSQTSIRNVAKLYLLILQQLIIQLAKWQLDIMNLNATFFRCEKTITF